MRIFLMTVLAVSSLALIVCILFQSGSSAGLSGTIAGGAEQLFGKKKSRGYDAVLAKITIAGAIVFIIVSLILVTME